VSECIEIIGDEADDRVTGLDISEFVMSFVFERLVTGIRESKLTRATEGKDGQFVDEKKKKSKLRMSEYIFGLLAIDRIGPVIIIIICY
jgi:hypothetical protein